MSFRCSCCRVLALLIVATSFLPACSKPPEQSRVGAVVEVSTSETPAVEVESSEIHWPENVEPAHVNMSLQQLSPRTYYVEGPPGTPTENEGFMSNAGVVVTSDGVVVFDALGTPSLAYKLQYLIRQITDKPIVKVVASHYHADHIYGLQIFKEMGAEIIAPAGAKDYLASEAANARLQERKESLFPWVDENTQLVVPDRYIEKDTELEVGDVKLKLIVLGSTHSQGDLMMQVEPDNVLFSGDLIFEGRIPFVAGSNPENWLQRLQNLDVSKIKAIVPGHGNASKNPQQALAFTRGYLQYLFQNMGDAVNNLNSFDEAYSQTDWSQYESLPAFVANRPNAYFVFLRLEAQSVQ